MDNLLVESGILVVCLKPRREEGSDLSHLGGGTP
jgi:hypothetical protein